MTDVLALDIGGTKMAAAMVDADGRVSSLRRLPTPHGSDPEPLWRTVTALLDDVVADAGSTPAGVGVGCSGPMSWPAGDVSPLNIPAWRGFPLRRRLARRTGSG